MTKDHVIYSSLLTSIFFIAAISLLSLQNNDIKIPQNNKTVTLDLSHKFNLNVATKEYSKKSQVSN